MDVTTIRMAEDQAVEVKLVARVLGMTVSELIRTAIAEYLTKRKGEVEFRQRLAERIEKDKHILDRLASNCCCGQITSRLMACPAHPTRVTPPGKRNGWVVRHCGNEWYHGVHLWWKVHQDPPYKMFRRGSVTFWCDGKCPDGCSICAR